MMKHFKYIVVLTAMAVGLPVLAQTAEKQYYKMPAEKVNLCSDDVPYNWRGENYYDSGTYYDTVKVAEPEVKDTVYTLILKVTEEYKKHVFLSFCTGDKVTYRGKTYDKEGLDTLIGTTTSGCDSVFYVHAQELSSEQKEVTIQLCQGESYIWHRPDGDSILTQEGYYCERFESEENGCVETRCIHLVVYKPVLYKTSVIACEADLPYYFSKKYLYESGVYYDTITGGVGGCRDSITQLTLTVVETKYKNDTVMICSDKGVQHKGRWIFSDTVVIDTLRSLGGCPSMVTTTHYITGLYYEHEDEYFYRDTAMKVVEWRGETYTEDGTYVVKKPAPDGCDSTWTLHLMTGYHYSFCQGDTVYYKKQKAYSDTILYDTLQNRFGRDSIIFMHYHMRTRVQKSYTNFKLCPGDSVIWEIHDTLYMPEKVLVDTVIIIRRPGTHFFTRSSRKESECDALYTAYVTELLPTMQYDSIFRCAFNHDSVPYYWKDHKDSVLCFSHTKTYFDTIGNNAVGCDSIHAIHVRIVENWRFDTLPLCPNGSVMVYDKKYTEPGDYEQWKLFEETKRIPGTKRDTTIYNDTVIYIHVVPADVYVSDVWDRARICKSEAPYAWYHRKYEYSGEYYDTIPSLTSECDSIVKLKLTVDTTYLHTISFNVCPGKTAKYNGQQFVPGVYYDSLKSTLTGCDSVIQIVVNAVPSYFFGDTVYINPGSTYLWEGRCERPDSILTKQGLYIDTCITAGGCDSIVLLDLRIKPTYTFHADTAVCENKLPVRWRNQVLYFPGTYYDSLHTQMYADSVYELTLTVNPVHRDTLDRYTCDGESFIIGGQTFYKDTFACVTEPSSQGCDSITVYRLHFIKSMEDSKVWHLGRDSFYVWYGDTLTIAGSYLKRERSIHGCDSVIHKLQLIVDPSYHIEQTVTICSNESYHWHGMRCDTAGDYHWYDRTKYDMDSIETLHLKVNPIKRDTMIINRCRGQVSPYPQSGTYNDTLRTSLGCDSITTSVVNIFPTYYRIDTIHLIAGSSVVWQDTTLTTPGIYDKHYVTSSICQCDSDYRAVVMLADTFCMIETQTICQGDTLEWHGQKLHQTGTYADRHYSIYHADSSYYMHLTVAPSYRIYKDTSLCAGGTIYYHGLAIDTAGQYIFPMGTSLGCDSTIILRVKGENPITTQKTIRLCEGQFITIHGKKFDKSCIYRDTLVTLAGCDSIVCYTIFVEPNYLIDTIATFTEGSKFIWKGHKGDIELTRAGVYVDSLTTISGCDSIIRLTLKVTRSYFFLDSMTLCRTELPYEWHGRLYQYSGTYYDSLLTASGRDSVYCLQLKVVEAFMKYETINACQGELVPLFDTVFTKSGLYYDTTYTYGCPQVTCYNINFRKPYKFIKYDEFCGNSTYTWFGHHNDTVLTREGIYYDINQTQYGCDSTYTLYLTKLPAYTIDTTLFFCEEELPYKHHGIEYRKDSDFVDSLRTIHGCDSVRITRYRINSRCSAFELYTKCQNETLLINDRFIKDDGEYHIPIGTDSVHRFRVLSYPVFDFTTDLGTHCDSVTYKGVTYRAHKNNDTIATDLRYKTVHGCDSIEHLKMVLHRSAEPKTNLQVIFDYAYIIFEGTRYDKTGVYTHKHQTIHGCDSTITLDLTVQETEHPGTLMLSYCVGETRPIEVFGKHYRPSMDTLISDTTRYEGFGMMKIQTARITVTRPFVITSMTAPKEICAEKLTRFQIGYEHTGSYPSRYELTFLPNQLTATPNPQKGEINEQDYIEVEMTSTGLCVHPGEYPYQIKFVTDCSLADTIIYGTLLVRYPASILEAYWDNTVAIVNENYNDGEWQLKPPYNWQIFTTSGDEKTSLIKPNHNSSYLTSDLLVPGDIVVVSPLRVGYEKHIPSCEFIFTPTQSEGRIPILVSPTAVRKSAHITIKSTAKGSYTVYNDTGHKIASGDLLDDTQTVQMPAVEGCYLLDIQPDNLGKQVHKIIVY